MERCAPLAGLGCRGRGVCGFVGVVDGLAPVQAGPRDPPTHSQPPRTRLPSCTPPQPTVPAQVIVNARKPDFFISSMSLYEVSRVERVVPGSPRPGCVWLVSVPLNGSRNEPREPGAW